MSKNKYNRISSLENNYSIFSIDYWRDATSQLTDIEMLCIAALLTALRIAIKGAKFYVVEGLAVTFGFFVNAVGSMIYGPVVALVASAISDTVGAVLFSGGQPYFFPFIFSEMVGGLIFALLLWRRKLTATRIIISRFLVTVICNLTIDPIINIWYYDIFLPGKIYKFIVPLRIVKNLVLLPVQSLLLILLITALIPPLKSNSLRLISKEQAKPAMGVKHYVIMGFLTLIACVGVAYYFFTYVAVK